MMLLQLQKKPLLAMIDDFLKMMAAERAASANTISAYSSDLTALQAVLKMPIENCEKENIEAFIASLAGNFSPRTIARKISSYRQFFSFLQDEGRREDNPALAIEMPKQPKTLPKFLSAEEVRKLLDAVVEDKSSRAVRLYAMIAILHATGLRVSELVTLKLSAAQQMVKSGQPLLLVKGKGSKERLVPVNQQALVALQQYMDIRKDKSVWLFPSRGKQGHITRQNFAVALKQIALKTNIDAKRVSPHILRHSFATHLLRGGADLRLIQQLLGHADITTTEIYTHIKPEQMKALVDKHHPLADG